MDELYYYQEKDLGSEKGPLPIDELRSMQQRGELPAGTMIRRAAEGGDWEPLKNQGKPTSAKIAMSIITFVFVLGIAGLRIKHRIDMRHQGDHVGDTIATVNSAMHSSAWKAGYENGESFGRGHADANEALMRSSASMQALDQGLSPTEANEYSSGFKAGYDVARRAAR